MSETPDLDSDEDISYPDELPNPPEEFICVESNHISYHPFTNQSIQDPLPLSLFTEGGFEFIFKSNLFDLRISSHSDCFSITIQSDDRYIDYLFESIDKLTNWLEELFEFSEGVSAVQIPHKSKTNAKRKIYGMKKSGGQISCSRMGISEESPIESMDECTDFSVHSTDIFSDFLCAVTVTQKTNTKKYYYIFTDAVIEFTYFVYQDRINLFDAYPIPQESYAFEYLYSSYDVSNIELVMQSSTFEPNKIVSVFV